MSHLFILCTQSPVIGEVVIYTAGVMYRTKVGYSSATLRSTRLHLAAWTVEYRGAVTPLYPI